MSAVRPIILAVELTARGDGFQVAASGHRGTVSHQIAPAALQELRAALARSRAGEQLFTTLFQGQVAACYHELRRLAQQSRQVLRLSFRLDLSSEAASWPLEALRDPQGGEHLALAVDLAISRTDPEWTNTRPFSFTPPLKVLHVSALPGNLAQLGETLVAAFTEGLSPLTANRSVRLKHTGAATQLRIEETLASENWHVLHFLGHGTSRAAVQYGALTLEGSDGTARGVSAERIAQLLSAHPPLSLVVLQPLPGQSPADAFGVLTKKLLQYMPAVLWLPHLGSPGAVSVFIRELYGRLAGGLPLDRATGYARRALAARYPGESGGLEAWSAPVLLANEAALKPPLKPAPAAAASPPVLQPARWPDPPAATPPSAAVHASSVRKDTPAIQPALEERRRAEQYDVFFCYNNAELQAVRDIESRLLQRGILPWNFRADSTPGQPWQILVEKEMARTPAAAIFYGPQGLGRWQEKHEVPTLQRHYVERECRIIPVILPGVVGSPTLSFLGNFTWIDFRERDPDPLEQLILAITWQRPAKR